MVLLGSNLDELTCRGARREGPQGAFVEIREGKRLKSRCEMTLSAGGSETPALEWFAAQE
jgi:hypothetical protein